MVARFAFWARNVRSQALFAAIRKFCRGNVLDVGGRDFFELAEQERFVFDSWTTLEYSSENVFEIKNERFKLIRGDGCRMPFHDQRFDTVLNIQVLEHVFEPVAMVKEMARVLKSDGVGIFLIPQTAVLHELPHHYYNFTRFWIVEAMRRAGFKIIELKPLGGVWSSMASHLLYFLFQSLRLKGYSTPECRRNFLFYLLYPFMILFTLICFPFCLLLSLGDLTEEPNNHLVVVKKTNIP